MSRVTAVFIGVPGPSDEVRVHGRAQSDVLGAETLLGRSE